MLLLDIKKRLISCLNCDFRILNMFYNQHYALLHNVGYKTYKAYATLYTH